MTRKPTRGVWDVYKLHLHMLDGTTADYFEFLDTQYVKYGKFLKNIIHYTLAIKYLFIKYSLIYM